MMNPQEAVAVLYRWREAGQAIILHFLGCVECQEAHLLEVSNQPHKYCSVCDILWAEEMRCEAQVIAILPDMPEEVRNEVPSTFKFMTGHDA